MVTSKGIARGRVTSYAYVFYPYRDGRPLFLTAEDVRAAVPRFFDERLDPKKNNLKRRPRIGERWWELAAPRPKMVTAKPLLASKYFGAPGSFVLNPSADALVLQGYAWLPKGALAEEFKSFKRPSDIALGYLALLNSEAFFARVRGNTSPVSGGQVDLSPRHVNDLALPDLRTLEGQESDLLSALVTYGRSLHVGQNVNREQIRAAENAAAQIFSQMEEPVHELAPPMEPIASLLRTGGEDPAREVRYNVIVHLISLAQEGNYEAIDEALAAATRSIASPAAYVTLLRTTFQFRGKLGGWVKLRDSAAQQLNESRDRAFILEGLFD